ncbi:MAG: pentapeptide repeat-containing protein, partial [Bacteroidota bacterium]
RGVHGFENISAKHGSLPDNFDWDEYGKMKDQQGKTVLYVAMENGNLPENIQSFSMKQMQNISQNDFDIKYDKHKKWLETNGREGERLVLQKYELSNINFPRNAQLQKADLSHSNLSRQDLSGADMRLDNLRGANLSGATLHKTKLAGADLSDANLSGANFYKADLRNTDLSNSILRDARLNGTLIDKANFNNAIVLNAEFQNIRFDSALNMDTALGWSDNKE